MRFGLKLVNRSCYIDISGHLSKIERILQEIHRTQASIGINEEERAERLDIDFPLRSCVVVHSQSLKNRRVSTKPSFRAKSLSYLSSLGLRSLGKMFRDFYLPRDIFYLVVITVVGLSGSGSTARRSTGFGIFSN